MSRYYFDLSDANGLHQDDEGIELASIDEVRDKVAMVLSDIAREEMSLEPEARLRLDVRDENGAGVYYGEVMFHHGATKQ